MTKIIGFQNIGVFIGFLERIIGTPDWRGLRCLWPVKDSYAYCIELPETSDIHIPEGAKEMANKHFSDNTRVRTVGEIWRYARPTARRHTPSSAASCWLIIFRGDSAELYDHMIDNAPGGLQLLEYQESGRNDSPKLRAFLVHGSNGEAIAHSPPPGCICYACDSIPNGGLAALPVGWAAPHIPEFLWPEQSHALVVYDQLDDSGHHAGLYEQSVPPIALVGLLKEEPPQALLITAGELSDGGRQVPWKVQKKSVTQVSDEEIASLVERPAVFRVRTRNDVFGQTILQVLDEAESRQIPEFSYAAVDWLDANGTERWHFIYSDRVDGKLLSAWNSLERFDIVPELQEDGIEVFVACGSRVSPPFGMVVATAEDRSSIVRRIRGLLGDPPEGTIVLVEASSENPDKPIVTHIPHAQSKPLSEVIRILVRDWHTDPPTKAIFESVSSTSVEKWRAKASNALISIAHDEYTELQNAATDSLSALEKEASRAIKALEEVSVPVREAIELTDSLRVSLTAGEASVEAACAALAKVSEQITQPRRKWLRDQTAAAAQLLREAAPRNDEISAVRELSISLQGRLNAEADRLKAGTQAVRDLFQPLEAAERAATESASAATALIAEIEMRASDAEKNVARLRVETSQRLDTASVLNEELNRNRSALAEERRNVELLERANSLLASENERTRLELVRRQKNAAAELNRLKLIRDVELPRLRAEADLVEERLGAINPVGIEDARASAQAVMEKLRARLHELEQARSAVTQLEQANVSLASEVKSLDAEIVTRRKSYEVELQRLKTERDRAVAVLLGETKAAQARINELSPIHTRQECERLGRELNALRNQIQQAFIDQTEIDGHAEKQNDLEAELARVQDALRARQIVVKDNSARIKVAQDTTIPQLQKREQLLQSLEPEKSEAQLTEITRRLDQLHEEIQRCERDKLQMEDAKARILAASANLQDIKSANEALGLELKTLKTEPPQPQEVNNTTARLPATDAVQAKSNVISAEEKMPRDDIAQEKSKQIGFWGKLINRFR